jgi:hypothetical protein
MRTLLAAAAFTALCLPAMAVEVKETVNTSAPPDRVWALIGHFDAIHNWLPSAASSPADRLDAPGSVRVITLKAPGNPKVTERLTAHAERSYSYAITQVDPKVLPVTAYTSTISVAPASGGSLVTWRSNFKPAGGADDAASSKAVTDLYRSGLDNIKTLTEK